MQARLPDSRAASACVIPAADGWSSYVEAIESAFGADCSHGVVMKQYATAGSAEQAALRYSPSKVIGIERIVVSGNPDVPSISTTYIERQNLTLRMSIKLRPAPRLMYTCRYLLVAVRSPPL